MIFLYCANYEKGGNGVCFSCKFCTGGSWPIYADKPVASLGIRKRKARGMKELKN